MIVVVVGKGGGGRIITNIHLVELFIKMIKARNKPNK